MAKRKKRTRFLSFGQMLNWRPITNAKLKGYTKPITKKQLSRLGARVTVKQASRPFSPKGIGKLVRTAYGPKVKKDMWGYYAPQYKRGQKRKLTADEKIDLELRTHEKLSDWAERGPEKFAPRLVKWKERGPGGTWVPKKGGRYLPIVRPRRIKPKPVWMTQEEAYADTTQPEWEAYKKKMKSRYPKRETPWTTFGDTLRSHKREKDEKQYVLEFPSPPALRERYQRLEKGKTSVKVGGWAQPSKAEKRVGLDKILRTPQERWHWSNIASDVEKTIRLGQSKWKPIYKPKGARSVFDQAAEDLYSYQYEPKEHLYRGKFTRPYLPAAHETLKPEEKSFLANLHRQRAKEEEKKYKEMEEFDKIYQEIEHKPVRAPTIHLKRERFEETPEPKKEEYEVQPTYPPKPSPEEAYEKRMDQEYIRAASTYAKAHPKDEDIPTDSSYYAGETKEDDYDLDELMEEIEAEEAKESD